MNSVSSTCQNCKKKFAIETEDFDFYEKIKVPPPTFCPECRIQRKLAWRNQHVFHKRKCDVPEHSHSIISIFSDSFPGVVYEKDYWWSDKWDALSYGQEYDFSRPFFEQFKKILHTVPLPSLWSFNVVNGDYANYSANSKNVYLGCSSVDSEDVCYAFYVDRVKEGVDLLQVTDTELSNTRVNCSQVSRSTVCVDSRQCVNCHFVFDCVNCNDCFMSSNLRNKSYVFRNNQLSREDYMEEIKKLNLHSRKARGLYKIEFEKLLKIAIYKFAHISNAPDCTGNDILNSSRIFNSFFVNESQNIKYSWRLPKSRDCYDVYAAIGLELCYEATVGGLSSYASHFYTHSSMCRNTEYSLFCNDCDSVFGCIGLKNKKFCILNKQYTESEYNSLLLKIKRQMIDVPYHDKKVNIYSYGEFFPIELSPFGYNESQAHQEFPLSENEIKSFGFTYIPQDIGQHNFTVTNLPDTIGEVGEDFYKEVIKCAHEGECKCQCTKAFRIHPIELMIYKKLNIPIPDLCPNCRNAEILCYRAPFKLWHRSCMCEKAGHDHEGKCKNEFETSYSPDSPEIVYCESCYQKEVI